MSLFALLKVSPPETKASLDPKIAELTAKLQYFESEGDKRLKEEEEKLLAGDFPDEEEEEKVVTPVDDGDRRGGRGGFRGGRGGNRGGRGGNRGGHRAGTAAGGDRRPHRDEDEEVYQSSGDEDQRVANKAKRPSNKKENLNFDEDNYPTL